MTNNVVFMVPLGPGAKHTIQFKYKVEYPVDRPIEYTEVSPLPM